ncbi:hypothetical protein LEMLEM_LOCUS24377 [Lemmus lemmus]
MPDCHMVVSGDCSESDTFCSTYSGTQSYRLERKSREISSPVYRGIIQKPRAGDWDQRKW